MSQIAISGLSFSYPGSHDLIFNAVNLTLDTRWRLALVGRNGRGKTTLLRLLAGDYAYHGSIQAAVDFDYFPCAVAQPRQPVRAVVAAICPQAMDWEVERELSLLGVEEAVLMRPFETLSGGEATKVLLAAQFLKEDGFPLIDEPTNHLDRQGREAVSRYLKGKQGFILVSHDRCFLDGCVDHVLAIGNQGITLTRGDYNHWHQEKELQDAAEAHQNEGLKKEIKRLNTAARRSAQWSDAVEKTKKGTRVSGLRPDRGHIGAKAAKMMKRSKAIEARRLEAADQKSTLLKEVEQVAALKLRPLSYHKEVLVAVSELEVDYGQGPVCLPLSLTLGRGERVVLSGPNGSGKSSVLGCICGEDIPHRGQCMVGSGLRISRVGQDTRQLVGSLWDYAAGWGIDESRFLAILRKMGFTRQQFETALSDYSPGQRKKVELARSLCESAHLYIWDEPMNDLDAYSREQLEGVLLSSAPTLLFVEHDRAFCEAVATREVSLE
ncbi:ribosomal protection-like ABC-F family protein [Eubacterium sp.]|uniref:ribosomal protection-like ABC-F family protein n=1 Tax=Eubacterium sp. TaxID=142586 RepID=UPI002FC944D9